MEQHTSQATGDSIGGWSDRVCCRGAGTPGYAPNEDLIRFLPYAVAFHTEPLMARKFAVLKGGHPTWYKSESREDDNLLSLIRAANSMQNQISGEPAIFSYFEWLRTYGAGGYDRPRRWGSFRGRG